MGISCSELSGSCDGRQATVTGLETLFVVILLGPANPRWS